MILAGFISRPPEAEARNPPNDLVETTSPGHPPSSTLSSHVETTSPGHPPELVPQPQTSQGCTQAGPQGRAIALQQSGCHSEPYLPQSPLRAALPDSVIEVGLEPLVAASTFCIPHKVLPPVILEIPSVSPELEELPESHQCPDTPGKWYQPPTQSPKRPRSKLPPSPRRPRKHFSSFGRWCE